MDKQNLSLQIQSLPKNTFSLTVKVPFAEIESAQKEVLSEKGKEIEIKGFRKGMAPENLVREQIGQQKLFELVLEKIIPDYYRSAVEKSGKNPIASPKIELISAKERQDWEIKFTSCEEPVIALGNYKEEIKKTAAGAKIWTPGQTPKDKPKEGEEKKDEKINKILDWLLKNIKIEISDILVEEEVNRKLASLLEQTQKLGITVDQYLASTGKTIDLLKSEYRSSSFQSLSLEFILEKIAEEEKITVSETDLRGAIDKAKAPEEKKILESQKYFLATLLRRQKTLDFLTDL